MNTTYSRNLLASTQLKRRSCMESNYRSWR